MLNLGGGTLESFINSLNEGLSKDTGNHRRVSEDESKVEIKSRRRSTLELPAVIYLPAKL